jgi:hypothetical protein
VQLPRLPGRCCRCNCCRAPRCGARETVTDHHSGTKRTTRAVTDCWLHTRMIGLHGRECHVLIMCPSCVLTAARPTAATQHAVSRTVKQAAPAHSASSMVHDPSLQLQRLRNARATWRLEGEGFLVHAGAGHAHRRLERCLSGTHEAWRAAQEGVRPLRAYRRGAGGGESLQLCCVARGEGEGGAWRREQGAGRRVRFRAGR